LGAEEIFFCFARGLDDLNPLRCGNLSTLELFFDSARDRVIHVIAAKDQMLANSDALHQRAFGARGDLNEGEVGGAAADICDQNEADTVEDLGEIALMAFAEMVKGSLGFFDEREVFQACLPGGGNGE
jgi:hypothetical protein